MKRWCRHRGSQWDRNRISSWKYWRCCTKKRFQKIRRSFPYISENLFSLKQKTAAEKVSYTAFSFPVLNHTVWFKFSQFLIREINTDKWSTFFPIIHFQIHSILRTFLSLFVPFSFCFPIQKVSQNVLLRAARHNVYERVIPGKLQVGKSPPTSLDSTRYLFRLFALQRTGARRAVLARCFSNVWREEKKDGGWEGKFGGCLGMNY